MRIDTRAESTPFPEEIIELNAKNKNIVAAAGGISVLGNIAGLMYAIKTKKSGWGKVGWFFLGGIIVAIPTGIVARSMVTKNNTAINKLKNPTAVPTAEEQRENDFFAQGGKFN